MGLTRKDFARYSRPVLKSRRWQVLRHQILERDGWTCACGCGQRALEVDHIQPVRTHPELAFDPANLQALARGCHTKKTRLECGFKEKTPERMAWDEAVADLVAETETPAKE